jgi:hypothetical protein
MMRCVKRWQALSVFRSSVSEANFGDLEYSGDTNNMEYVIGRAMQSGNRIKAIIDPANPPAVSYLSYIYVIDEKSLQAYLKKI